MHINLSQLSAVEITKFSKNIKDKCSGHAFMEESVQEATKLFYNSFVTGNGSSSFALVHVFKSCFYQELPDDVQSYIQNKVTTKSIVSQSRYLTLLGTCGDLDAWCDRKKSGNHIAFPMDEPQLSHKYPMIAALLTQIGEYPLCEVNAGIDFLKNDQHKNYGLYCIEDAGDMMSIPDQTNFVNTHSIKSVVGFGGKFSSGNVYAIIIFSKELIRKNTAKSFLAINPAIKQIMLPFEIEGNIFKNSLHAPNSNGISINNDESGINTKQFHKNSIDYHKKYLIEREMSAAIQAELDMTNECMIEVTEDLKRANKSLEDEIIKRLQAENELQQSQSQLQAVFDNAAACIYIKDIEGKHLFINKQYEKVFHITGDTIKGKTVYDIFPREMAEALHKTDQKVLESKTPMEFEEIVLHDDVPHTYLSIKFPLYASNDVPYGVCGISTDITQRKEMEIELKKMNALLKQDAGEYAERLGKQHIELAMESQERKKTESALQESEKRFRVMFDQAAVGFALQEVKTGNYILVNKKYNEIMSNAPLVHPDDRQAVLVNKQKLIDGTIHEFIMEVWFFHENGDTVWVNMTVSPFWQTGEEPDFYMITVEDLTERKKAIAALEESNEKIQLLLNSTGEGIYGIDEQGICTFANTACVKLLGYETPHQLIGNQMHKMIHHTHRDGMPYPIEECNVFQAYQKGESIHVIDDIAWRADGSFFPVEYRSYPIYKNNKNIGAVVTFQDITARKRMEKELLHSKKMQALGTITSGVAHEVNNILAAIDGNIQMLMRQNKGRKMLLDSLKIVHKYVKDGAEIVRRLNEFTKKNEDSPGYVPVDLAELTRHVVRFLSPRWQDMAQGTGIKYRINTDGLKKVRDIKGNPSELREVVLNIITNALDAMPKGGTLCFNIWEDEDNVNLSISDTGAGMTEEVISKIFDPFFTSKEKGTGLGLSVVYGIVKRHGGVIHVSSTVGMGSVFLLSFPSKKEVYTVEEAQIIGTKKGMMEDNVLVLDDANTVSDAVLEYGGGNKILVIEDELVIGKVLCNFLTEGGYVVEYCNNGADALDKLKQYKYDIVLCDLGMPGVSGWDIMNAVEMLQEKPKVGIITGFLNTADTFPDNKIKANFIINKPFDLEVVLEHIQQIL
ncbi:histidine kinase [Candidatus Kuenenia stuttgartiensis]|jgi:PAS domain S-box-containing protein|uniref:histidine kinase n=2 Tax=Kuenenia stuttgartiensis TaxID=174633 RepID=Q1Q662_KUEST|nr:MULTISPECIES: PAS domain S-box protein [Kuenenia]MBE7548318.1 PAS domain S-box protein [Planctomycetia bacterium]MBW7941672.1 PAS domain S-box protein [Candidatus Kuenenia stuttgartiensis]MBZ0191156.1 PAS domain S-box protein [Candidatus Kuenenia stuttgartiensis]MCF6151513.1 PAS domain S-box protein [Candidatus Kuenenia stuttgartiensis]MCL4726809.1 PAS domain S-box protein [Candidatus Kuenenia stuttgartiensis]